MAKREVRLVAMKVVTREETGQWVLRGPMLIASHQDHQRRAINGRDGIYRMSRDTDRSQDRSRRNESGLTNACCGGDVADSQITAGRTRQMPNGHLALKKTKTREATHYPTVRYS